MYADARELHRVDATTASPDPVAVLSGFRGPLAPGAHSAASYDGAGKIGLQFRRRFWEEEDQIYGGRSWTDQEIGQIIYPSHGFSGRKGILIGYYMDFKGTMRERTAAERERLALEQGARIHSQYTTEFETAFSVSWPRVPWSRGSWRSESAVAHEALIALRRPDGRVHFAGDYMTDMSSWMQGAFESARESDGDHAAAPRQGNRRRAERQANGTMRRRKCAATAPVSRYENELCSLAGARASNSCVVAVTRVEGALQRAFPTAARCDPCGRIC